METQRRDGAPDAGETPIVRVEGAQVACDGDGPLGHPRVYLNVAARTLVACPYCGRRFLRAPA